MHEQKFEQLNWRIVFEIKRNFVLCPRRTVSDSFAVCNVFVLDICSTLKYNKLTNAFMSSYPNKFGANLILRNFWCEGNFSIWI